MTALELRREAAQLLAQSFGLHALGLPVDVAHAPALEAEQLETVARACELVAGPGEETEDEAPADLPDDTEYDGARRAA